MLCYIQHTKASANIDELIKVLKESYLEHGLEKAQNIFLSHKKVMETGKCHVSERRQQVPPSTHEEKYHQKKQRRDAHYHRLQ